MSVVQSTNIGPKEQERLQKETKQLLQEKLQYNRQGFFSIMFSLLDGLERLGTSYKGVMGVLTKARNAFYRLSSNYRKIKERYKNTENEIKKEQSQKEIKQLQIKLQECEKDADRTTQLLITTMFSLMDELEIILPLNDSMSALTKIRNSVQELSSNYSELKKSM